MALTDNIRFKQGSLSALDRQAITNGTLWFTTDENAIYLDTNGQRIRFGDYVTVANIDALPETGHAYESALYYAKAENVLARWDNTKGWVQLNAAGLTKINVTGTGNVLSGAQITLDPETGAKVLTFSTVAVATSEGMQSLQTKVSALEASVAANTAAIAVLNGDGETVGSVAKAIADAKAELEQKIDAVDALADQGIADAKAASDAAAQVQTNLNSTNTKVTGLETEVGNLKAAMGEGGGVDEKINNAITGVVGTTDDEAGEATIHGALNAAEAAQEAADAAADAADAAQDTADANASAIQGLGTRLTGAEADIDNLQAAVETLNANDKTEGSVDYKVALEVAKILNDNDPSDIDTLEEIASWIKNDTAGVATLVNRLDAVESKNQSQDTVISGLDATVAANKTAAETAVSDLRTALLGDADTYTNLGLAEAAIEAAKAQADKGVTDAKAASDAAALVQTNLNSTNTRVSGAESEITGLKERMTTAEGEIDDLQAADIAIRGEITTATSTLESKLVGTAKTYTNLGLVETAVEGHSTSINGINTQLTAINANLTWDTFE